MSEVLANFIFLLATVLSLLILARVIISWVTPGSGGPLAAFVYAGHRADPGPDPRPAPATGGFDFSPLIALLILQVITRIIGRVL